MEETILIPLMMAVVLVYYAFRLLVLHDTESITGKNSGKFKDKEKYVSCAGKLLLFLAAASAAMAVLLYFSVYAAIGEIIIAFVVFGILWKRMHDKYGDGSSYRKK